MKGLNFGVEAGERCLPPRVEGIIEVEVGIVTGYRQHNPATGQQISDNENQKKKN